jgi:hypothetical protein
MPVVRQAVGADHRQRVHRVFVNGALAYAGDAPTTLARAGRMLVRR